MAVAKKISHLYLPVLLEGETSHAWTQVSLCYEAFGTLGYLD